MEITWLKCPSCGAVIKKDALSEVFRCEHCGNEYLFHGDLLARRIAAGSDSQAAELAVQRLREDIAELEQAHSDASDARSRMAYLVFYSAIAFVFGMVFLGIGLSAKLGAYFAIGLGTLLLSGALVYFGFHSMTGWAATEQKLMAKAKTARRKLQDAELVLTPKL